MKSTVWGFVLALIFAVVVIFFIESGRSLLQLIGGFVLFIIPATFISSFRSSAAAFLLGAYSVAILYIIYKLSLFDMIAGILLAIIIGGCIHYFRILPYKPFSMEKYKKLAGQQRRND